MPDLKIAKDLSLPIDAVTQKLAWLGRTGSGKTYGCKRMVEEMIRAGAQVVVLDPVGVWAGLRLGPKSLDVAVLGGLFGDILLEHTAGAVVADLVVDHGASMVLDLSQALDAPRTRFAEAFARQFFARKKAAPSAVHLVIEECQEFIPQNHQHGEEKMLHEFQRIAKLGRNFGIGLSLISQRPQEVNKKALNQAECVFAFQLTGPHERKALEYWLSDKGSGSEKLADLLPRLEVGAPHVWSPQWLKISKVVRILPIDTLDTSQTPKVGEKAYALRKLQPIDLGALRAAMAATIEKQKQEDPELLRQEIAELKQELADAGAHEPRIVEVPAVSEAMLQRLERAIATFQRAGLGAVEAARDLAGALPTSAMPPQVPLSDMPPAKRVAFKGVANLSETAPKASIRGSIQTSTPDLEDAGQAKVERLILIAVAQHQGHELTRQRLALLVGNHRNSKVFVRSLDALRGRGALQGLMVTDKGLKEVGGFEPLPTGPALLDWYCANKLDPSEVKILRVIAGARGKLTREALAERVGYHRNSKVFVNGLGHLRGLGLVDGLGLSASAR